MCGYPGAELLGVAEVSGSTISSPLPARGYTASILLVT